MTGQIEKLRAVADFAEKHWLAAHISSVTGLIHGAEVTLYERDHESSIGVLLRWADAMKVEFVKLKDGSNFYFMNVIGEISGAGTVTVTNLSSKDETRSILSAALADGMVPLPLVRACMVTEDGGEAA